MRNWKLNLAVVVCVLGCLTVAMAEGNPWLDAKPGQWIEHKTVTDMGATKMEQTTKMTVKAKDATSITLANEMTMNGQKMPAQEITVPLQASGTAPTAPGTHVEKIGEGDETIKVGGKDYACHWVKNRITHEAQNVKMVNTSTIWMCKDVPVNNIVKMVIDQESPTKMTSTQELVGSGQ